MHFVEAKSHPVFADTPLPKSIENSRFLQSLIKIGIKIAKKTMGFYQSVFIDVQKLMSFYTFFISVWHTSRIKCLLLRFLYYVREHAVAKKQEKHSVFSSFCERTMGEP